ncbi:MAG: OmpA family protein [Sulfurihydrogenibium sp.]|jgi:outer membrane protein OmpA-like peptidoglycan-associated protein|nr:OmpA family protein [Sulfurihydrogenibium sp.]
MLDIIYANYQLDNYTLPTETYIISSQKTPPAKLTELSEVEIIKTITETKRTTSTTKVTAYFPFNSYKLYPKTKKELSEKIKEALGNEKILELKTVGWASPEGSEKYNLKLSEKRAKTLSKLLKNNLNTNNIIYYGAGECKETNTNLFKYCRKAESIIKSEKLETKTTEKSTIIEDTPENIQKQIQKLTQENLNTSQQTNNNNDPTKKVIENIIKEKLLETFKNQNSQNNNNAGK